MNETLEQLKNKYPSMSHLIKYPPVEGCTRCNGTGEYINGGGNQGPCFCVYVGLSTELHKEIHESMNVVAKQGKAEIENV